MDKENFDITIYSLAFGKDNIQEWMESYRKKCQRSRSEFSNEIKDLIVRLNLAKLHQNGNLPYSEYCVIENSPLRYIKLNILEFLLQEFEDYLDFLLKRTSTGHIETPTASKSNEENVEPKYRINQIALKYVYQGEIVTLNNCDDIAVKYGFKAGRKLFQQYSFYRSDANRKGRPNPYSRTTTQNKIKLLKSVIDLINEDCRQRVESEIDILNGYLENDF